MRLISFKLDPSGVKTLNQIKKSKNVYINFIINTLYKLL
jgi:hypothetical protein